MLSARFADLPLTEFARRAAAELARNPLPDSRLGRWADLPVLQLIADEAAIATLGKRREAAIRRTFESQVSSYAASLRDAIEVADEDVSDAWQPATRLAAARDRILLFGGEAPLSGREVVEFLEVTRTTLANWRRSGRILGLPHGSDRKLVYPRWQFDPKRPTHLLPGLTEVLVGSKGREPWGIADVLTAPTPALDGETPIARLRRSGANAVQEVTAILDATYL
jgi:hypothetical protein